MRRNQTFPIWPAGSDSRRNTIQCVDSTVLALIELICLPVLGQILARVVPARLALASDLVFVSNAGGDST